MSSTADTYHPRTMDDNLVVSIKTQRALNQGIKACRCSKCGKVGHTRRACCNPWAEFDTSYKGNVVQVEDLMDGSYIVGASRT